MSDDLGRQLKALHERVPDGDPTLLPVLRGGRKRKLQRQFIGSSLVLLVALASAAGVGQILRDNDHPAPKEGSETASHEDGIFVPAQKGESTYELTDLEILYPWAPVDSRGIPDDQRDSYCAIRDEWECGHRREQAGFSYQWHWATNKYPGAVMCRVTLKSADGSSVGRTTWQLSGLETKSRQAHVVGVRVSDQPRTAQAECEAGAYPSGRDLSVEFVRSESYSPDYPAGQSPPPDRIRLVFQAKALAEDHVDSRMCIGTLWFESGRKKTGRFTTNQGEGIWEFETGYPASDPVVDAMMRCRAIRATDS